MKLLFDKNLSFKLVTKLETFFPGSSQVKLLGLDKSDDQAIWEFAQQNGFALVTKDVDYFERSVLLGHPPKVIWLRCGNQTTQYIEHLLRSHATRICECERDEATSCLELY